MKSILLTASLLTLAAFTVSAEEDFYEPDDERPAPAVSEQPKPAPKPKPALLKTAGTRTGPVYIGHRVVTERYTEWGWVWKEKEDWRKGRWVMLQETSGTISIPSRMSGNLKSDDNYEYRLYGEFLPTKGYDPNYDLYVDVFKLKGYELIGPADPVLLSPPTTSAGTKKRNLFTPRNRSVDYDY